MSKEIELRANVSRETLMHLEKYADLIEKWNPRINLISPKSMDQLWIRHFEDSAQLLDLAPKSATTWVDLGSGGGFPGMIIAILKNEDANFVMTFVESDQRKAAFLRTVIRECGLNSSVICDRIEKVEGLAGEVVSARALAPLPQLFELSEPHLRSDGVAIFPKGARAMEEVAAAQEKWSFTYEAVPSKTDAAATLLKIGDIKRV